MRATAARTATWMLAFGACLLVTAPFASAVAPAAVGTASSPPVPGSPDRAGGSGAVVVVELDRAIDNVSERLVARGLRSAADEGATLVVIRLDTPGGLVSAMRRIVAHIFQSRVPVAVYVAPDGARAASAGTFITAAGGVAAMAPTTNIGAASVVGGQGEDLPETLERKATQDAAALLRSIAERRGRNAAALEAAVFEATAYSAGEAVELGIVDLVAADLGDLLAQLDGREMPVGATTAIVRTAGAPVRTIDLTVFEEVLAFLSDPTIAFLLVSFGGLGIVAEMLNFGMIVPGVAGAAMLVLGFAGLGQLPFSWAGIAMIGLAMALFLAEAFNPGLGLFGAAGVLALVLGGLFLVGFFGAPALPDAPSFHVNRWVIFGTAFVFAGVVAVFTWQLRSVRRIPAYLSPVSAAGMVGRTAVVTSPLAPDGVVLFAGEHWNATLVGAPDAAGVAIGTLVRVVGNTGFVLHVELLPSVEPGTEERAFDGDP